MEINFNDGHKNYLNYSKVYKEIKEKVKADQSFLESTDAEKKDYLMATKAVMETIIMNPNCLTTREFKDPDILYILTPNNSNDVNTYYKNKPEHKLDQSGYFIKSLITVFFTKNKLQAEKGKEESLVERLIDEQAKFRPLNTMPKVSSLEDPVENVINQTPQRKMKA